MSWPVAMALRWSFWMARAAESRRRPRERISGAGPWSWRQAVPSSSGGWMSTERWGGGGGVVAVVQPLHQGVEAAAEAVFVHAQVPVGDGVVEFGEVVGVRVLLRRRMKVNQRAGRV